MPRYATPADPDRPSLGELTLAHLARLRRSAPYPWQFHVADVAGELNDDCTGFKYRTVVLSVPRRAGKTTLNLAHNLAVMDQLPDCRAWYTANKREVATKLMRDEWEPMLIPLAEHYRVRRAQGSEGVMKVRGGSSRLQLFAPSGTSLHSTNADCVTVDECWAIGQELGESMLQGIKPAQLTRPWRQLWLVSAGGTVESTWWDHWLTLGEQGAEGVACFDYGADPTAADYDPSDPRTWQLAHPTAGIAFPLDVLQAEWDSRTDDASFERNYLNVWPRPSSAIATAGLDIEQWRAAAEPQTRADRVTAIALDVAADRSTASVAIAGADTAGRIVIEVVDNRHGVAWLAGVVRDTRLKHKGAVVVADSIVAGSALAELTSQRVTVEPIGASDHARACATLVDLLGSGRLVHRSQGVLDDAVHGAARRPLGDGWLWSRARSAADISPLVACTLAGWTALSRRRTGAPLAVASASASDLTAARNSASKWGHGRRAAQRRATRPITGTG